MAYYLTFKRNILKFKDKKYDANVLLNLQHNAQIRNFPALLVELHFKLSLLILYSGLTVKTDRQTIDWKSEYLGSHLLPLP